MCFYRFQNGIFILLQLPWPDLDVHANLRQSVEIYGWELVTNNEGS